MSKAWKFPAARPARGTRLARRPRVEGLEGRALLATSTPTIYVVNSIADTGTGSGSVGDLRYCIDEANKNTNPAGSIIEFASQPFNTAQTIDLEHGTLTLDDVAAPEVILGPGQSKLTIDGLAASTVFTIDEGVTANISNLTVSGGKATGAGGGISSDGLLTLTDCSVADNAVKTTRKGTGSTGGAGVYNGPDGTLSVDFCTISGNSVTNPNNAGSPGSGGGLLNAGSATVSDSTFSANSAANASGAGLANAGTLTIVDDTIADNTTTRAGSGAGLLNSGTLTAVNDTVAYNVVKGTGAIGGGVDLTGGSAILINTIVAENTFGTGKNATASDVASATGALDVADSGYDLIGTGGSGGLVAGTDGNLVGVADPGLGKLANNGGPTETIALETGSVAIAAGNVAAITNPPFPGPPTTDQRGTGYARVVDGTVDIGAYQTQS